MPLTADDPVHRFVLHRAGRTSASSFGLAHAAFDDSHWLLGGERRFPERRPAHSLAGHLNLQSDRLSRRRSWHQEISTLAKLAGVVISLVSLVAVPVGTIIGAAALLYLLSGWKEIPGTT